MRAKRFLDWSFGHYLNIAHPSFVGTGSGTGTRTSAPALAATVA
jgi:hypothetical protein